MYMYCLLHIQYVQYEEMRGIVCTCINTCTSELYYYVHVHVHVYTCTF